MDNELFNLFEQLDDTPLKRSDIKRAPFGWPGGKYRSVDKILDILPYRDIFVEVFGGSGIVMLNRRLSKLDVFNDRHSGITAFYRVIKDAEKLKKLIEWLELSVHSREEWLFCHDQWSNQTDDVVRAAMWYYMIKQSYVQLGDAWGRVTKNLDGNNKRYHVSKILPLFQDAHTRLQYTQIENLDWKQCITDYASLDTVFYCDPPYIDATQPYKYKFEEPQHKQFLDLIFNTQGFFAVSSYDNPLYNGYEWDNVVTWDTFTSMPQATFGRVPSTEVLYIKDNK